jgi:hypothetical protein
MFEKQFDELREVAEKENLDCIYCPECGLRLSEEEEYLGSGCDWGSSFCETCGHCHCDQSC